MLYGTLPITKTVAAALGAVIAVLAVAIVGLAVGWRLSVTRNRKSYKKWNEEVRLPLYDCSTASQDPHSLDLRVSGCAHCDRTGIASLCAVVLSAS